MTAHTIERIVYLHFRKSFSYSEIAYTLDVPEKLVKEAVINEELTTDYMRAKYVHQLNVPLPAQMEKIA